MSDFKAVDRRCLELLQDAGSQQLDVRLQVYAAAYTIEEALRDEHLGTIVYSKDTPALFEA